MTGFAWELILRAIAKGATASGGETIAPKTNPTDQASPRASGGRGGSHGREHHTADSKQGNRTQTEAKFSPTHRDRRRVD